MDEVPELTLEASELSSRARGTLLGAAVGDALGWPQEQRSSIVGGEKARRVEPRPEFRAWARTSGSRFASYREIVGEGNYSDDTQLLLAVARACLRGDDWWQYLTRVELPAWTLYQRGGGLAVLAAARAWADGKPPWSSQSTASSQTRSDRYFRAGSNGAAMRVAPHALATVTADESELARRVALDAIATHGHLRAIAGAIAHALVLRGALRRSGTVGYGDLLDELAGSPTWAMFSIESVLPDEWFDARPGGQRALASDWLQTVEEIQQLLAIARDGLARGAMADDEATLRDLGCFDKKVNGSGTITAVAAAYLATRSAARPLAGLVRAAYLRSADTDTLASMTASILGALHGSEWLAVLGTGVQDANYIASFAAELPASSESPAAEPSDESPPDVTTKTIKMFNEMLNASETSGTFVDGRRFALEDKEELESPKKTQVTRFHLRTTDGQTIIIDRTERNKAPDREVVPRPTTAPTAATGRFNASVIAVSLPVASAARAANFYRGVVGLPVRGGHGFVDLSPSLRLIEYAHGRPRSFGHTIEIVVDDLDAVLERIPGPYEVGLLREATLTDPDGYSLIVRERQR